ncbi:hypothetical protein EDC01DRAFT_718553 [Geopyxis carbonaria]|nr:hypothetical protein EDC01DRAFT_718553 [Geopyxis carbonaria]
MTQDVEPTSSSAASVQLPHLSDKDDHQLQLDDAHYKLQSWQDLKTIIEENRLSDLGRVPSDLRRYLSWSEKIRKEYGTIQAFILKERLGWTDQTPKNITPFADPDDYKVLINDWPYGNEPGILHLVSWTKSPIPSDDTIGDLTPESRKILERYIYETFIKHLGEDNVLWFKNWASLQSVRSVEHIHILIRKYTPEFLATVVGKDVGDQKSRPIGELIKEKEDSLGMASDHI